MDLIQKHGYTHTQTCVTKYLDTPWPSRHIIVTVAGGLWKPPIQSYFSFSSVQTRKLAISSPGLFPACLVLLIKLGVLHPTSKVVMKNKWESMFICSFQSVKLPPMCQAFVGSRCGTKGGQGLDHTNLGTMVRTSGFVLNAMRGPWRKVSFVPGIVSPQCVCYSALPPGSPVGYSISTCLKPNPAIFSLESFPCWLLSKSPTSIT